MNPLAQSLKQACWVLGTDTDVGKTFVTAHLLRVMAGKGISVQGIKPVQTGCVQTEQGMQAPDVAVYQAIAPDVPSFALHMLHAPCSPHLAQVLDNASEPLTSVGIAATLQQHIQAKELTLIEGAGGLFVPINQQETQLDCVVATGLPVILVIANRLGAINHALLSIEALQQRGIHIAGLVFTTVAETVTELDKQINADTLATIQRLSAIDTIVSFPYFNYCNSNNNYYANYCNSIAVELESFIDVLLNTIEEKENSNSIVAEMEFDKTHIWHPYTSISNPLPVYKAVKTQGNCIYLHDGTELVDGMASWWATIHGYNHLYLLQALHKQAHRMPHVMFGGLTHEPALQLAQQLLQITPAGLQHVFFADSGSVAVEVALKMAVQYQQAVGKPEKQRIISLEGAYHGDTLGAMSVCDPVNSMHALFQSVLPVHIFLAKPHNAFHTEFDADCFAVTENLFKQHAHSVAALIVEPIVQGAGGMWMYHPEHLRRLKALCEEHEVLLIADEIATGFGRTGKMFACEWAGVEPDIMCVGKALTGGTLSLAATLATTQVAQGISCNSCNSRNDGVLMHGPTFMANPLACAVAVASLELLSKTPWLQQVACMQSQMQKGFAQCLAFSAVQDVRVLGSIGVVELKHAVNTARLQHYFVKEHQVWIRPFGRLLYIMPPYTITPVQLERLILAIIAAIKANIWE